MTDPALRDQDRDLDAAMERHHFPDECACPDPVRVSSCCGEPMDGMYCTACRDHNGEDCASCERPLGGGA